MNWSESEANLKQILKVTGSELKANVKQMWSELEANIKRTGSELKRIGSELETNWNLWSELKRIYNYYVLNESNWANIRFTEADFTEAKFGDDPYNHINIINQIKK